MSQSPLAPPIPQAQPRQKQPPQQQQRRSPKSHIGGHMSHHSDDRLSPQGEDGKFSAYTRPGLPPGGQLEQGQRTGTRFGSRSPTAGGTGQSRQREVTRGPALVSTSVCLSLVTGCLSVVCYWLSVCHLCESVHLTLVIGCLCVTCLSIDIGCLSVTCLSIDIGCLSVTCYWLSVCHLSVN